MTGLDLAITGIFGEIFRPQVHRIFRHGLNIATMAKIAATTTTTTQQSTNDSQGTTVLRDDQHKMLYKELRKGPEHTVRK